MHKSNVLLFSSFTNFYLDKWLFLASVALGSGYRI